MLANSLALWQQQGLMRQRQVVHANVNFASNDYLGLHQHAAITAAMITAVQQYGNGSGASAMVCGYSDSHQELEQAMARWLKVDRAILFSSGYLANIGSITSLIARKDMVLADKLCHASLLAGIQLARSKHIRYRHLDMSHLRQLAAAQQPKLIVSESIFSMQGDSAPIVELLEIAKECQSGLLIDDAHGIGVLGKTGGGVCEAYHITQQQFSCLVLPLGKAFNAMGAIVAGRAEVIETILQFASSYRYSTALPPALAATLLTSLRIIQQEDWRRQKLYRNIQFFNDRAALYGLTVLSSELTPIRVIMVGDNQKAMALQDGLLKQGMHIAAIRPPTVPAGTARLRISLNALHTESEIDFLLEKISKWYNLNINQFTSSQDGDFLPTS